MNLLAQVAAPELNFWNGESLSTNLWIKIAIGLVIGFGLVVACLFLPTKARRPIIATATFLAGAFWVIYYFWPKPHDRGPNDIPSNIVESVSFWLSDAASARVGDFANVLNAFIIGLGIFSLTRVHLRKVNRRQGDYKFSILLLASIVVMVVVGFWDWKMKLDNPDVARNFTNVQYAADFLFDGLFQTMESAMFSIIAFFILSAAYRAFRVRSVEATILLAAALIMMLSLMGWLVHYWDGTVSNLAGWETDHFLNNFKLTDSANWIKATLQTPSIRAIEFGVGLGALAMGLRLWLSLEKGGVNR